MNSGFSGDTAYDFNSDENSAKWKGLLTAALKKVRVLFFYLPDFQKGDQFKNIASDKRQNLKTNSY